MDLLEAIGQRHSVRSYEDRPIEADAKEELEKYIEKLNEESGLHMQLITDEPKAFTGLKVLIVAGYGSFKGLKNYIALIGKKGADLHENCGYYGEKLVLRAQQLGLRTCWVGGSYRKVPEAFDLEGGEELAAIIAIGYGTTDGKPHKSKPLEKLMKVEGEAPDWFYKGLEADILAPTAMNQQKFVISWKDGKVSAEAGIGPFSKMDLGIVKYHFEVGAGRKIGW